MLNNLSNEILFLLAHIGLITSIVLFVVGLICFTISEVKEK